MATSFEGICRLCAKKEKFTKNILHTGNDLLLGLIKKFLHITVNENDTFPKIICLICEEKIVSFQLFILECGKVQENFHKLYIQNNSQGVQVIKDEESTCGYTEQSPIKTEVKTEPSAEGLDLEATSDDHILEQLDDSYHPIDDDGFDDLDELSIASLKQLDDATLNHVENDTLKNIAKQQVNEEDKKTLKLLMDNPFSKPRDFIKKSCYICNKQLKTWNCLASHFHKKHKSKPVAFCLCGFVIKTKNSIYQHVPEHKENVQNTVIESRGESNDDKYCKLEAADFFKFECNKCEKMFSSWYTLKRHTLRVHKVTPVLTCICGLIVRSRSVLYKHVKDHRNPNVFCCDRCPRIANSLEKIQKHKSKHINNADQKVPCALCGKICKNKVALKSHEISHVPVEERKVYECEICNTKFTTRSSVESHKRVVHEKVKGFVCDLCGFACGTGGELRQHRAIHSDEKPFVCAKCSKRFKTYSNLKTHMDTHEDTAYPCFVCNKILNSRRTLRKHLLVHEDKCKHVCSYCHKAFKRRQTLKVHLHTHTGDKPLSCKWCSERFSYASTLRSHRLRCHPDKLVAGGCASGASDASGGYVSYNNEEYNMKNEQTQHEK